jgi:hypothetical protein
MPATPANVADHMASHIIVANISFVLTSSTSSALIAALFSILSYSYYLRRHRRSPKSATTGISSHTIVASSVGRAC